MKNEISFAEIEYRISSCLSIACIADKEIYEEELKVIHKFILGQGIAFETFDKILDYYKGKILDDSLFKEFKESMTILKNNQDPSLLFDMSSTIKSVIYDSDGELSDLETLINNYLNEENY